MIAFLSGKLIEKDANSIIVDVGGIGYEAIISLSTYYELGDVGSEVSLRIYTYVREDTLQLFGFITPKERALFLKLITVSGIGPKLAITMLSGMGADEIIIAIRSDNLVALTSIPGIGKKTAERLVIELRDKIADIGAKDGSTKPNVNIAEESGNNEIYDDTISALINLGYQQKDAAKAVNKAIQDGTEMSVQKLIRKSLQSLANG